MDNPMDASKKRRGRAAETQDAEKGNQTPKKRARTEFKLSNGKLLKCKSNNYYDHYETEVKTITDLLALDAFYLEGHVDKAKAANIPFSTIHRLAPHLRKLEVMIGLEDVKKQVLSIVLYFLQQFDKRNNDMLHTVVYGGPGVGKTRFINILAEIYAALGVLPTAKVTVAKRADLIAGYLGQTAMKTRKVIESAKGGVLLMDEAYAVGDKEQRDSYSRECIDTLNQALSEEKSELVCIIAGYKDDLNERFFKSNPGLERRFPFRVSIEDYSAAHLRDIFVQIVRDNGWDLDDGAANVEWFEKNREHFRFNGGDMETLFTKTKFLHSVRVFCAREKKCFTSEDVQAGLASFLDNDEVRERKKKEHMMSHIYL